MAEFDKRIDIEDFLAFLKSYCDSNKSIMKKYRAAEKQETCSDAHVIAICLMLVRALKEKEELILLEIEVSYFDDKAFQFKDIISYHVCILN